MIVVPDDFASALVNENGAAGRSWIDGLPRAVESLCQRWNLTVDGPPLHGYLAIVVPVRRNGELCALKVSWINESTAHEIAALKIWNGHGAVRLVEADPAIAALLLERLDSGRSLEDIPIDEAIAVAAQLVRRLSVPAHDNLPHLSDVSERLAITIFERWEQLNRPIARRVIDAARDIAIQVGPGAGSLLVNYDLHYGNVLAGEREPWLAIDPKVVVGDPEYGPAQLLWTRLEDIEREGGLSHHFHALVDQAGLDLPRARAWTLVRTIDYWLWALGIGLTGDPVRCEFISAWLTQ
jgi:streptomycin 6-kinase